MSDMSAVPMATVAWVAVVGAGALARVAAPVPLVAPVPRQATVGGTTPVCFAYASGRAPGAVMQCPRTTVPAQQRTLGGVLSLASENSTVLLATPGQTGHYAGNSALQALRRGPRSPSTRHTGR